MWSSRLGGFKSNLTDWLKKFGDEIKKRKMKLTEKTSRPDFLPSPILKLNYMRVAPTWFSWLRRFKGNLKDH
jgi:hypothetical protein